LLSNRKFTGRKRIAFDSNVHKIAIFSDELENVKQLIFKVWKRQHKNWKKCSDLHNGLQEEICLKGVLLAKKQNLSNQLDILKDTNSRLIDYVKSINKKVGTTNSGKEFSEMTENNKWRKKKNLNRRMKLRLVCRVLWPCTRVLKIRKYWWADC
jgi:hypothetical protein